MEPYIYVSVFISATITMHKMVGYRLQNVISWMRDHIMVLSTAYLLPFTYPSPLSSWAHQWGATDDKRFAFYIAQCPVCCTGESDLHFIPRQTFSFRRTQTQLLWEAISHPAITTRRLFTHISTTVYVQVPICTS